MQVDAVQQRPADLAQVALEDGAGAAALVRCVAEVAAGAPVQTSTDLEHEPRMPAEGGQRFVARQALAGGQFAGSSADRRSYPAVKTAC